MNYLIRNAASALKKSSAQKLNTSVTTSSFTKTVLTRKENQPITIHNI